MAIAVGVLLALSILLGGASRENALRLALLELAALGPMALAVIGALDRRLWSEHRLAVWLIVAISALPLLQLLPLPPGIWTRLPGREESVLAFSIAGLAAPWAPISLAPELTWRSFLALIPPLTAFLGVLLVSPDNRRRLMVIAIGLAVASLLLGAAQLSGARGLYPYQTTASGDVVGFFANRNHLATLCLMTIPFAAVFLGAATRRRRPIDRLVMWACAVFLVLALFGLMSIRSRAGIVLALPAFALGGLAAWLAAGRGISWGRVAAAGAVLVVLAVAGYLGGERVLQRFEGGGASTESRLTAWPIIAEAAGDYQPLGSGVGSFDAVYRAHEPLELLDPTFLNHAHNEYLETWLEAGWLGAALLVAFLVWFGQRSWRAWRPGESGDPTLQRAASIAILIVLTHSFVDYPARTEAIAVMLAICCAILESQIPAKSSRRRSSQA